MKLKPILRCIFLYFMPSCLIRLWLQMVDHRDYSGLKIGFSLILVDELKLDNHCHIGNGNKIKINNLIMDFGSGIGNKNKFFGRFSVHLGPKSEISSYNEFTSDNNPYDKRILFLNEGSVIGGKNHILDLTRNIIIGKHSLMAGVYSQIWTHGFYLSKNGKDSWRVDGCVTIGDNVYIGSNSVICSGVSVCNNVSIGAHVCVSKDLTESGMYVSQPVRHIPFDPDVQVGNLTVIQEKPFKIVEKTKK